MTFLAHKSQIRPDEEQQQILWTLSNQCRLMYNILLGQRKDRMKRIREHKEDTGCDDKHSSRSKSCDQDLKYIQKGDQDQLLKETRNHSSDGCDDDCPDYHQYWEFYRVYRDTLTDSTLEIIDGSWKSWMKQLGNGDSKARPPRFKRFTSFDKNKMGNTIYTRKNHGMLLDLDNNKVGMKYFPDSESYRSVPLMFKLVTPFQDFVSRQVRDRKITFKEVAQVIFSYDDTVDKYFVSIIAKFTDPPAYEDNGEYLSIDLGLRNIVAWVNSRGESKIIPNRRYFKYWLPKIREVASKRDRCKTTYARFHHGEVMEISSFNHFPSMSCKKNPACDHKLRGWKVWERSKRWYSYQRKLKQMQRKSMKQSRDWKHWISNRIINNTPANTIIIGDLNIKNMMKRAEERMVKQKSSLNVMFSDTGLSDFITMLTYKAELVGKKVVKINERYTSKDCALCGHRHTSKRGHGNIPCDNCDEIIDRDVNGAVNIMRKFLEKPVSDIDPAITPQTFMQWYRKENNYV